MEFSMNKTKQPIIDLTKPILVSLESFTDLQNFKVVSDDGSRIETTLQVMDEISRNGAKYPSDDLRKSLTTSRRVQEHVANKVWWGEAEHPIPDGIGKDGLPTGRPSLHRLLRVEPTRWSHRIDSFWFDNDHIKGIIEFGGPLGHIYRDSILKGGSNYAFSVRAYTPNYVKKEGNGVSFVEKKFPIHVVTYDIVTGPGHEKARMVDPDKFKISTASNPVALESVDYEFDNVYDEVKDIIASQSQESVNLISDLYGIDLSKAKMIVKDPNFVNIALENNTSIDVPLNHVLVNNIINH